jgi:hypothetical protein
MPGVRSEVIFSFRVGRNNRMDDLIADQALTAIADSLIRGASAEYVLEPAQQNVVVQMGGVTDGRLWLIMCDGGDVELTFGGVPGTAAQLTSAPGTYNTGFAVDTPFSFEVDGTIVNVTFTSADQSRAQVIARINAACVLAGLEPRAWAAPNSSAAIRLTGLDASASGHVEIVTPLAQIGFASAGAEASGTDPSAAGAPIQMRRLATAGTRLAAGMTSFFMGTVQASSLIMSNLSSEQPANVYVCVAGDIDPSPGIC